MKRSITTVCFLGLLSLGVLAHAESTAQSTTDPTAPIHKRADALLRAVRSKEWSNCVAFVAATTDKKDSETLRRMGVPKDATPDVVALKVGEWFKQLYSVVKPGGVVEIRMRDKNLALIEYMHEDKDGFYMRRVEGEWYYTLDERAEPDIPATGASPNR